MDNPRVTLDSLHNGERERFRALSARAEVALAKRYPQLKPITVQHLLSDELLRDARTFHFVVTGSEVEISPENETAIGILVADLVASSEIAQRNLAFASVEQRSKLEQDFYASLRVGEALSLERAGQLEMRREQFIQDGLSRV